MKLNFEIPFSFFSQESENRWVTIQKDKKPNGVDVKVIRDFTDAGIDVQMICGDVTSKQFYERQ